eukprot:GEMP01026336.1.p1 GENE.GEMP01026336.1~~GEMP01026336.1.p1  ORF type:complete len:425 (+),score=92.63 GEMP01026336.1:270-1544(+)
MSIWLLGFGALCTSGAVSGAARKGEVYSTNAMCLKSNCVNPIFPALRLAGAMVMEEQETRGWACADDWKSVRQASSFCSRAIDYPFSVPTGGKVQDHLVDADHKAILAFTSHLNGIGLDAWDHPEPWAPNTHACVQSVWRLTCNTYFPKCSAINAAQYLRPCRSACEDFVNTCAVECCDEGVKCVFSHTEVMEDGEVETKGYVNHVGPSVLCTGSAPRSSAGGIRPSWLLLALLLALSLVLQGCDHWGGYMIPNDISVPHRRKALWRMQTDYTIKSQVVKKIDGVRQLNSCMTPGIGVAEVCSGRGHCATWNPGDLANPMWICKCESPWAGMECNIKRYSQFTAWLLSVFFGYLGVDLMYLGFPVRGFAKLVSLGGFGIWWMVDIVQGAAQPSDDFEDSQDSRGPYLKGVPKADYSVVFVGKPL